MNSYTTLIITSIIFMLMSGCTGEPKPVLTEQQIKEKKEDTRKYNELVRKYYKKRIPFDEFDKIGQPETLEGTNNSIWVVYFSKGDFTLVSDKNTDIVRTVHTGRHPYLPN